jgi:hypothetical protein
MSLIMPGIQNDIGYIFIPLYLMDNVPESMDNAF